MSDMTVGTMTDDDDFEDGSTQDTMQAVVLAAAIDGDTTVRSRLGTLRDTFDEPYRTVCTVLVSQLDGQQYVDRNTMEVALADVPLTREVPSGQPRTMSPPQVLSLIYTHDVQPGQAAAYTELLESRLKQRAREDFKQRAVDTATQFGDDPQALAHEIQRLTATDRRRQSDEYPRELLEIIPYAKDLMGQQRGGQFQGLDSGFNHINHICNGLDTGLMVMAAPPGMGKTTLFHQVACQVAEKEQLPVIFVSMEQSKQELRAKALARFSKLQYRHILRGRLRSDNPVDRDKLLEAVQRYAVLGNHLTIIEGDDTTTVDTVEKAAAAAMSRASAQRCLIIVDYLQILPLRAQDVGRVTSTKDRVDLHVSSLRRVARRLDSPVLAISAENRAGYKSKNLDVFKESGGIEYSADVAMVLTPDRKTSVGTDSEYRPLDVSIIKNRNGERGVVKLKFYAARAEFVETGKEEYVDEEAQ